MIIIVVVIIIHTRSNIITSRILSSPVVIIVIITVVIIVVWFTSTIKARVISSSTHSSHVTIAIVVHFPKHHSTMTSKSKRVRRIRRINTNQIRIKMWIRWRIIHWILRWRCCCYWYIQCRRKWLLRCIWRRRQQHWLYRLRRQRLLLWSGQWRIIHRPTTHIRRIIHRT